MEVTPSQFESRCRFCGCTRGWEGKEVGENHKGELKRMNLLVVLLPNLLTLLLWLWLLSLSGRSLLLGRRLIFTTLCLQGACSPSFLAHIGPCLLERAPHTAHSSKSNIFISAAQMTVGRQTSPACFLHRQWHMLRHPSGQPHLHYADMLRMSVYISGCA